MGKPDPQLRPKFAVWLYVRGIKASEAGRAVGCSSEWVRRINLPFADPDRARPSAELRRAIEAYTDGAVGLTDWEPAELVEAAS